MSVYTMWCAVTQHDNVQPHTATVQQITNLHLGYLLHSAYLLYLTSCDYHVCRSFKEVLDEKSSAWMKRLKRPCIAGYRVSQKIFFSKESRH